MTEAKSSVHVAGKTIDLPIKKGTMGAEVIDMRSLFAQTGLWFRSRLHLDGKLRVQDNLY